MSTWDGQNFWQIWHILFAGIFVSSSSCKALYITVPFVLMSGTTMSPVLLSILEYRVHTMMHLWGRFKSSVNRCLLFKIIIRTENLLFHKLAMPTMSMKNASTWVAQVFPRGSMMIFAVGPQLRLQMTKSCLMFCSVTLYRRKSVVEIVIEVGVSMKSCHNILHNNLKMLLVCQHTDYRIERNMSE